MRQIANLPYFGKLFILLLLAFSHVSVTPSAVQRAMQQFHALPDGGDVESIKFHAGRQIAQINRLNVVWLKRHS